MNKTPNDIWRGTNFISSPFMSHHISFVIQLRKRMNIFWFYEVFLDEYIIMVTKFD